MVQCRKYGEELPGLKQPPMPGKTGQDIFEHVSEKAWQAWLQHQTMLINEKQLNLMDQESRKYLAEQREQFFSNADFDKADGYIPPAG
jgi:Fe-S cluster biosynthesis and repair protein YggX